MKTKTSFLLIVLGLLFGCQQNKSTTSDAGVSVPPVTSKIKKVMIKVAILYPNGEGKTFDMDYYSTKHMPMAATLLVSL